jgi:hypothetical protein
VAAAGATQREPRDVDEHVACLRDARRRSLELIEDLLTTSAGSARSSRS